MKILTVESSIFYLRVQPRHVSHATPRLAQLDGPDGVLLRYVEHFPDGGLGAAKERERQWKSHTQTPSFSFGTAQGRDYDT